MATDPARAVELRVAIDGRVISDRFPGIGRYVHNLVRALPEADPSVRVLLLHDPGASRGRLDPTELASGSCELVPVDAPVRSVAAQWRLRSALGAARADVFHATYWVTCYRPGIPTVLSLYDLIGLGPASGLGTLKRAGLGSVLRLAVRASSHVVTLSDWSAGAIRAWRPARGRPVTVTPLAADPSFNAPDDAAVVAARAALDLPPRYVAYMGSFKPHKNLATLVRAWPDAAERASDCALILAGGDAAGEEQLRAATQSLPPWARVRVLGPVPESLAPGFLAGAAAFAFPSLAEGFGLPPLEAMAAGTPVIAANAASIPEVVGDAGILVPPLDIEGWSAALASVLTDPELARRLRAAGQARAARFTWLATARATAAAYRACRQ